MRNQLLRTIQSPKRFLFGRKHFVTMDHLQFLLDNFQKSFIGKSDRFLLFTYSTVVTCSVKEILNRISKIQLQNEISNDSESQFLFPSVMKSVKSSTFSISKFDLPSESEIFEIIQESKTIAFQSAVKVGLIAKTSKLSEVNFVCPILPHAESIMKSQSASSTKIEMSSTKDVPISLRVN